MLVGYFGASELSECRWEMRVGGDKRAKTAMLMTLKLNIK
jgi:hypothetical protein